MTGKEAHRFWSHSDIHRVIVLGDRETLERTDLLEKQAGEHGAVIVESYAFGPGEARSSDDLHEVPAVVDALRRAVEIRTDIWLPFPMKDLTREEHLRRLDLVLERYGLDLLLGPHLEPCPEEGINPVDFALRLEVHAVDDLDRAVLAAAGLHILAEEIETALAEAASTVPHEIPADGQQAPDVPTGMEARPLPTVPAPNAPWDQRREPLKELAARLTESGLNQTAAAEIIHGLGHRPPGGGAFTQVTVSMLLRGRYDRGSVR